jgi:hypothetical protein
MDALARSVVNAVAGFVGDDYSAHVSIAKLHQRTFIADYRALVRARDGAVEAGYLVNTGRKVRGATVWQMLSPPGSAIAWLDGAAHRPPTREEYLARGGVIVDNSHCEPTVPDDENECESSAHCESTVPPTVSSQ